jgi:hypothetical protein
MAETSFLTREEAELLARQELGHDADILGVEVLPGPATETPGFWIFHPATAAFASGLSTESFAHRLPPVVVDRRTARVTRPFAAGQRYSVADLGAEEWIILPPEPRVDAAAADGIDGLNLTRGEEDALRALEHFRLRRARRDDGDRLEATAVATDPRLIEEGLGRAGIHRLGPAWTVPDAGPDERVRVTGNPETASVDFWLSGNGGTASPWTIGPRDIELARLVEASLTGAEWIRFWR